MNDKIGVSTKHLRVKHGYWIKGQRNQGWNYENYNRESQYVRDGNYNRGNNYNQNNYSNRNHRVGPYVPSQNRESSPRDARGNLACIEDVVQKMMRMFDLNNENVKEMRIDISDTRKKLMLMLYRSSILRYI